MDNHDFVGRSITAHGPAGAITWNNNERASCSLPAHKRTCNMHLAAGCVLLALYCRDEFKQCVSFYTW